jgi:hypothetical protein
LAANLKDDNYILGFLHFLSKPAKPMLGLDISSSAVKLIELSESAGGYKVPMLGDIPFFFRQAFQK